MKRSETLAPLSREHHIALALALSLRRATADTAETLALRARAFWEAESREHFRLEEEVLIPVFARHAGAEDPDIQRLLTEHADLTHRFTALAEDSATAELHELGTRLADHVRFEERHLFGRVEAELDADELQRVGHALAS